MTDDSGNMVLYNLNIDIDIDPCAIDPFAITCFWLDRSHREA